VLTRYQKQKIEKSKNRKNDKEKCTEVPKLSGAENDYPVSAKTTWITSSKITWSHFGSTIYRI